MKKEKNKMAKFDYKKWVVENKYGKTPSYSHYGSGKLNEQETGLTFYGCAECDPESYDYNFEGGLGDPYTCGPPVTYQTDLGDDLMSQLWIMNLGQINCNNGNQSNQELCDTIGYEGRRLYTELNVANQMCASGSTFPTGSEVEFACPEGTAPNYPGVNNIYYCNPDLIGGSMTNYPSQGFETYVAMCCTGSIEDSTDDYQPFCCDINAINFGQTANGQPYGTNPGEAEQYLMINGPEGDMCDNSICQGNVNVPDPEGMPFDDKAGADSGGDSDQQSQQADKAFMKTKDKRRQADRRDPKGQSTRDPRRLQETLIKMLNKIKK